MVCLWLQLKLAKSSFSGIIALATTKHNRSPYPLCPAAHTDPLTVCVQVDFWAIQSSWTCMHKNASASHLKVWKRAYVFFWRVAHNEESLLNINLKLCEREWRRVRACVWGQNWTGIKPDVQRFDKAHLWSFFLPQKCPSCSISKCRHAHTRPVIKTHWSVQDRKRKKERQQEQSQMGLSQEERYQDVITASVLLDIVLVKY